MAKRWPPMVGIVGFDGGYKPAVALALPPGEEEPTAEEFTGEEPPPGDTGACCIDDSCSVLTQAECMAANGAFLGVGTPCTPNPCPICDCHLNVTLQTDCVQWNEPDVQPPWPGTWDCVGGFSLDNHLLVDDECVLFGHSRVRYRFQIVDAPEGCTLRWAVFTEFKQNSGDDSVITDVIMTAPITAGSSVIGPFEVDPPGDQGSCGGFPNTWRSAPDPVVPFIPFDELGGCLIGDSCFNLSRCQCEEIFFGIFLGEGNLCPP